MGNFMPTPAVRFAAEALTKAQLDGFACVFCGVEALRMFVVGLVAGYGQVFACEDHRFPACRWCHKADVELRGLAAEVRPMAERPDDPWYGCEPCLGIIERGLYARLGDAPAAAAVVVAGDDDAASEASSAAAAARARGEHSGQEHERMASAAADRGRRLRAVVVDDPMMPMVDEGSGLSLQTVFHVAFVFGLRYARQLDAAAIERAAAAAEELYGAHLTTAELAELGAEFGRALTGVLARRGAELDDAACIGGRR